MKKLTLNYYEDVNDCFDDPNVHLEHTKKVEDTTFFYNDLVKNLMLYSTGLSFYVDTEAKSYAHSDQTQIEISETTKVGELEHTLKLIAVTLDPSLIKDLLKNE